MLIQKGKASGCSRCSYKTKGKADLKIKESVESTKAISVIKDKDVDVLPTVDEECPKCKHEKAHFWTLQTRSGDESETKFYRCKKCKHTWREYR
jgi:DNA-directed RNA polymerase subunit M